MGYYDIAQICLNRHVMNPITGGHPELNKKRCEKCGEITIMNCPICNANIKGDFHVEGVIDFSPYQKPLFCHSCGKALPWTERAQQSSNELIEFSEILSAEEKDDFKEAVNDLLKDSPKTIVAQSKVKKYIGKAGQELGKGIRTIITDIVSETVKKSIWG